MVITVPSPPNVGSSEPSDVSRASAKREFGPMYAAAPATTIFPFAWMRTAYAKSSRGVKSMDTLPVAAAEGWIQGAVGLVSDDREAGVRAAEPHLSGNDDLAVGLDRHREAVVLGGREIGPDDAVAPERRVQIAGAVRAAGALAKTSASPVMNGNTARRRIDRP